MPAAVRQRLIFDTRPLQPEERVAYWERQCRDNVVSLRCSPHAEEGLVARQVCVEAGALRLGKTSANAHVIERTPQMIRAHPQESVFVNVVLRGGTFTYQRGHCAKLQPQEALVYDARHPYLIGGGPDFELLHIDIPVAVFHRHLLRDDLAQPLQIDGTDRTAQLYLRTLSRLVLAQVDGRGGAAARDDEPAGAGADVEQQVCDLLAALVRQSREGAAPLSALSAGHLLAAKAYIDEHLDDDGLQAAQVAQAVGISERHLRRLFAAQDLTLADHLQARRLDLAHRLLRAGAGRGATVAEIAYRCGFASAAHFARCFKQRFGLTPTQLRQQAGH